MPLHTTRVGLLMVIVAAVSLLGGAYRQLAPGAKGAVLLTGGLGFIGSHVTEELLRRGYSVTIYDNESTGHNHNRRAREMVPMDIRCVNELEKVGKCDYVIHLAAAISVAESMKLPAKYTDNNIHGSQNVIDWAVARGVTRMVAASSAAVYGNPKGKDLPIQETQPYGGLSPYADSKYKMEGLMRAAGAKGLDATALRFFNVYGPRQDPKSEYTGVISVFLDRGNNGQEVTINGDGSNTRDFVYVGDVARAIVTAMEFSGAFDVFNVCTGRETTLEHLSLTIKALLGSSSKISHGPARPGDIAKSVCDPSKAKEKLGFTAGFTVEQGLARTAAWFRAEKAKAKGAPAPALKSGARRRLLREAESSF